MMRWQQIKELVIVDLLQANRQSNQNSQSDKVNKANLWWRLLLQNGIFILIFVLFFGTVFFNVPLAEYPGLYTQSLSFMAIFLFFQLYQIIFNLFFDDANLSEYLSLPFSVGELFVSKVLTIVLNTAAFFILPFVLMILLGWQTGHSLFFVLPISLLSTLVFVLVMILIPFVLIYGLHQIPFYLRHKKIFTIVIYILLFIGLFYFIYSTETTEYVDTALLDPTPTPLFLGFYEIFIRGSYGAGWLRMGGWAFVAAALSFIAFQWLIPQLYSEEQTHPASRSKPKRQAQGTTKTHSLRRLLVGYQLRQLQDTTFIIQMVFSKLYFPLIVIAPMLFSEGTLDVSFLAEVPTFWGIFVLIGFAFSFLTTGEISVSGVIISFDKENYHYFKSLPLSFLKYMQFKFWFSFFIEWLIGGFIISAIAFYIHLPLFFYLSTLFGFTLGTFAFALFYFMRDYRLLNLDWNHFTELMQRGINQFVRFFISFLLIIVGMIAIMSLSFWLLANNQQTLTITISTLITVVVILVAIGMYQYAKRKFWIHFNQ